MNRDEHKAAIKATLDNLNKALKFAAHAGYNVEITVIPHQFVSGVSAEHITASIREDIE